MLGMDEYNIKFREGLNISRYFDEEELRTEPTPEVDYTDFASIGYYDGFEYGKYLARVGMTYDMKEENVIAVIDKSFARAYDKYQEAINKETVSKVK